MALFAVEEVYQWIKANTTSSLNLNLSRFHGKCCGACLIPFNISQQKFQPIIAGIGVKKFKLRWGSFHFRLNKVKVKSKT